MRDRRHAAHSTGSPVDGDVRSDLREVLEELLEWRFRDPGVWSSVERAVAAARSAWDAWNPGDLERAVGDLERLSPDRNVRRAGAPRDDSGSAGEPVGDELRDRVVVLIEDVDDADRGVGSEKR